MLFKVMSHLLSIAIAKFVIVALSNTVAAGMKGSTEVVPDTHKQDSLKKLCKFWKTNLMESEGCEFVSVFFKDFQSNQLYTIAFAEDEDFETNSLHTIKQ